MKHINSFEIEKWATKNIAHNTQLNTTDPDTLRFQVQAVVQQLLLLGHDITASYSDWLSLGFALAHGLGEDGRPHYHALCQLYPNYDPAQCDAKYSSCLKGNNQGITIKTFFQMAKNAGVDLSPIARISATSATSATPPFVSSKTIKNNINNMYNIDNNINTLNTTTIESTNDDSSTTPGGVAEVAEVAESTSEPPICDNTNLPTFSDKIPPDDLPLFLQVASSTQEHTHSRDLMILATIYTLSAATPNYFGLYDGRKVYPTGYLLVPAPAASGKGDIIACRNLVLPVEDIIRQTYLRDLEQYHHDLAAWQSLDKSQRADSPCPMQPPFRSLFISANSSTTSLCQAISDNGGFGLIFETEGNTMANVLKTDYGDYTSVLCKAFQHEHIAYTRRKENEHVVVQSPRLSMVLTLTPGQVAALINSYESGFGSRLTQYILPRQLYWRNVFEVKDRSNDEIFTHLGLCFLPLYKELLSRHDQPIQFLFTQPQQNHFNQFFSQLQHEQVSQLGDDLVAVVRRLGLTTFRIAMMLTILRQVDPNVNPKVDPPTPFINPETQALICDDRDFQTALTITNCVINHAAYVYASLVPHPDSDSLDKVSQAINPSKLAVLNALPDNFTTKDFIAAAKKANITPRTAERYLGDLYAKHQLITRVQIGYYKKVKSNTQKHENTSL